MADVWFARDRSGASTPALADLLAEAPGAVSAIADPKPPAAPAVAAQGGVAPGPASPAGASSGLEDDLRQSGPLV